MRINSHAHVFNLRSVFTQETMHILLNRLQLERMPDQLVEILRDKLADYLDKKIDSETIFAMLDERAKGTSELAGLVKQLSIGGASIDLKIDGVLAKLSSPAASYVRKKLMDMYDLNENGEIKQTLLDTIEFLRISLLPSIERVAAEVMAQLKNDDILVTLMMDITDGTDDGKLFTKQINATSDLILAYPGRILPFIMVNTIRPDHLEIMKAALEKQGFWGVKLYPSLGYPVYSDAMFKIYDYCQSHGIPLMTHCTSGGFRKTEATAQLASPVSWRNVLEKFPNLKICFGHFGGGENLIQPSIPPDSWTQSILDLMANFKDVYADLSYHTDGMIGRADMAIDRATAKKNYVKNIISLLQKSPTRERLIFGTDFWMVRQVTEDDDYWDFFSKTFTPTQFKLLATDNPTEYLGLPGASAQSNWLIERHIAFFDSKKMMVAGAPAKWLVDAVKSTFGTTKKLVVLGAPSWSDTNVVHLILWEFLKNEQIRKADMELKLPYADYGRFKLHNLIYWDQSAESAAFETEVRGVASDVNEFFMSRYKKWTTYRDGITEIIARRRLIDSLKNPDWYVYQLAALCESLYHVSTPLPGGAKS